MARLTPHEEDALEFERMLCRQFARLRDVTKRHMSHLSVRHYRFIMTRVVDFAIAERHTFNPKEEAITQWFERIVLREVRHPKRGRT